MFNLQRENMTGGGLSSAINPLELIINKELFVDYAIAGKECKYAGFLPISDIDYSQYVITFRVFGTRADKGIYDF